MSSKASEREVIFVDVRRIYPSDCDVEVKYMTPHWWKPTASDWVGIMKLGWRSANPAGASKAELRLPEEWEVDRQAVAVFKGASLPKETNDFYQFCYVCNDGKVLGASLPFQFEGVKLTDGVLLDETKCSTDKERSCPSAAAEVYSSNPSNAENQKDAYKIRAVRYNFMSWARLLLATAVLLHGICILQRLPPLYPEYRRGNVQVGEIQMEPVTREQYLQSKLDEAAAEINATAAEAAKLKAKLEEMKKQAEGLELILENCPLPEIKEMKNQAQDLELILENREPPETESYNETTATEDRRWNNTDRQNATNAFSYLWISMMAPYLFPDLW